MRVLIAEDEKRLAKALREILEQHSWMADTVYDGGDAVEYGVSGIYDVIVLDVMLPVMDGMAAARELRARRVSTPILMLTARSAVSDKVAGLDSGADDYMTKPFAPEELLARIRALTRRQGEVTGDELTFGDLTLAVGASLLRCGGREARLNLKEAEIMKLLLGRPSSILSKDEIITRVWGYDSEASDGNVEAYMSFLRRKLTFLGSRVSITAVKKQGYLLEAPNA